MVFNCWIGGIGEFWISGKMGFYFGVVVRVYLEYIL